MLRSPLQQFALQAFFDTIDELYEQYDDVENYPYSGHPDIKVPPGEEDKYLLCSQNCKNGFKSIVKIHLRNDGPSEVVIWGNDKASLARHKDEYVGNNQWNKTRSIRYDNLQVLQRALNSVMLPEMGLRPKEGDTGLSCKVNDSDYLFKIEKKLELRTRPDAEDTTSVAVVCSMSSREAWEEQAERDEESCMDPEQEDTWRCGGLWVRRSCYMDFLDGS